MIEGTPIVSRIKELGFKITVNFPTVFRSLYLKNPPPFSKTCSPINMVDDLTSSVSLAPQANPWAAKLEFRRNINGQRVDQQSIVSKELVEAMGRRKLCHHHFLLGDCKKKCGYRHESSPLSEEELMALLHVARKGRCRRGGACVDKLCIYGHGYSEIQLVVTDENI